MKGATITSCTITSSARNGTAFPRPAEKPLAMQDWLNRPRPGLLRWLGRHQAKGR